MLLGELIFWFHIQPRTEMELEVAAVLSKSQHNLPSDQELTEAEKKALLKLSLEEVQNFFNAN